MAIDFDALSGRYVDFGDVTPIEGAAEASFAFTVSFDTISFLTRGIFSKWGFFSSSTCFIIEEFDTTELRFLAGDPGIRRKTSGAGIGAGDLVRAVITWKGGAANADAVKFWLNGVLVANVESAVGANAATLEACTAPVTVGSGAGGHATNNAVDGSVSEVAIYDKVVPDWFAIAYGKGLSPRFYRRDGILYAPLWRTEHLKDLWNGNNGTNVNGTTAAHPPVYYPTSPLLSPPQPPPPPVTAPIPVDLVLQSGIKKDLVFKDSKADLRVHTGKINIER